MLDDRELLNLQAEHELRRRNRTFEEWLKVTSPENRWNVAHLEYMRNEIEPIFHNEPIKLMCLAPPRHGKSEQNTVHLSAGYLYKFPDRRVIIGAYNQTFANGFSIHSKRLYKKTTPFTGQLNTVAEWTTHIGGGLKVAGMRSGVTGKGANLMLLDDPIKGYEEAYSTTFRDKVWNTYLLDFFTRLEPRGSIILTLTPWHTDDLRGRILNSKDGKNWKVIEFPALAKPNDILGRKVGEALWPWRFSREDLLEKKAAIGDDYFNALYQVSPVVAEGNIIKRKWFIIESTADWPIKYDFIGQYWDTACKTEERHDYSVCVTLAKCKGVIYILNVLRVKLEFPELCDAVVEQEKYYKPHFIGVEDNSSGTQVLQGLSRSDELLIKPEKLEAGNTKDIKILRAKSISPILKNEGVHVPEDAYWLEDFLDELCVFPAAKHDDQVDAFTHGMDHQRDSGYDFMALIGR
jgi:predicted phage terminase large subunit-like protein